MSTAAEAINKYQQEMARPVPVPAAPDPVVAQIAANCLKLNDRDRQVVAALIRQLLRFSGVQS